MIRSRFSLILLMLISLAIFALGIFLLKGNSYVLNIWTDIFWTSSSILCVFRCFKTSGKMELRSLRMAWRWFGIGASFWTLGMFVWSWRQLVQGVHLPFPDVSTFLFLSIVPCNIVGLIYYCWNVSHLENKLISLMDIGVSLCVISFVCIILFYRALIEYEGSLFYLLMVMAYPFLNITALFFATLQIWESKPVNKLPFTFLMLGLASFTGVNIAYAYGLLHRFYQPGVMLDILWTVGFLFFYLAASEEEAQSTRPTQTGFLLLKPNLTRALLPGLTLFFVIAAAYTYQNGFQGIDSILLLISVIFTLLMGLRGWSAQSAQFKLQTMADQYSKKLDAVIQQMPAGLVITDVDTDNIYFYNKQAEQILHGKLSFISELKKDNEEVDLSIDGDNFTVLRKISNIETKFKEKFSILTFVDITEKKQVYEEMKRVAQMREDFLLLVSHELKTPLTTLKLGMQIIDKKISDDLKKVLRPCLEEIRRFENLTNDLINISNIDAGRLSLEPERINLADIVRNVFSRFEFELNSKHYRVSFNVMDDEYGNWDQLRIEQVIINLLNNAIKYGERKPIEVSVYKEGAFAVFTIRDHGPGIAIKEQERIFRKFERASSTKNYGGFGIGLFVSKTIVDAHKGSIEVRDGEGGGAVFTVKLPVQDT